MRRYYVVVAGRPGLPNSEIYNIGTTSSRLAHIFAETEYRENKKLDSNIHVATTIAFDSDKEEEARGFIFRLVKEMEKDAAARSSEQHSKDDQS